MNKSKRVSWWDKKYGKECVCGITKARLRPGSGADGLSYIIKLECGHCFYRTALQAWVGSFQYKSPTCPMCRREFDPVIVKLK
jgi:hypothetical protein